MVMRNPDGSDHLLAHHDDPKDCDEPEMVHVTLHLVEQTQALVRALTGEMAAIAADVALIRMHLGIERIRT